jgi:hypothetical protein
MNKQLPYLAMDGVLCDRPHEGCFIGGKHNYARDNISNTTKKETTKVTRTLSADQLSCYVGMRIRNPAAADRYWARCAGTAQDAAIDDETAARIKEFLSDKLSDKDHTKLCSMLDGDDEAQDTEPPPVDPDAEPIGKLAGDESFRKQFPDAAKIGIDISLQPNRLMSSWDYWTAMLRLATVRILFATIGLRALAIMNICSGPRQSKPPLTRK